MKRRMVLYLHGGQTHSFPMIDAENEDAIRRDFLNAINEVKDGEANRAITWDGLTFIAAWLVGFYFEDVPTESKIDDWHRRINERLVAAQEKLVEAVLKEARSGDEWKGFE